MTKCVPLSSSSFGQPVPGLAAFWATAGRMQIESTHNSLSPLMWSFPLR